ncbi:MAG TPA: hypothetical protein PKH39_11970, partial [Woeseiaceae bacterium]|nr:hypothetical protein [Woeseiaceae bacterium]
MFRLFRTALLFCAAAAIPACGFQLQGAFTPPVGMERTYIATDDRYSQFYRALEKRLLAAGLELTDTPDSATAIFSITFDTTDQRVLSVSARHVPT